MRILDDVDLVLILYVSWLAKNDWVNIKQSVGVCVLQFCISQSDNGEIQLCVYSVNQITACVHDIYTSFQCNYLIISNFIQISQ